MRTGGAAEGQRTLQGRERQTLPAHLLNRPFTEDTETDKVKIYTTCIKDRSTLIIT